MNTYVVEDWTDSMLFNIDISPHRLCGYVASNYIFIKIEYKSTNQISLGEIRKYFGPVKSPSGLQSKKAPPDTTREVYV